MTDTLAAAPEADGPDCPPDDLGCFLKILLNGGNAINALSITQEHADQMYWGCMRGEMKLPDGFNAAAPKMIGALHKIEQAAMEFQVLYRTACGYRNQGLPKS